MVNRRRRFDPRQGLLLLVAWIPFACVSRPAPAPQPLPVARVAVDTLAPGLVHLRYSGTGTALEAHVVTVDLHRSGLRIESALATGVIAGRERTSDMARRHHAPGDSVLVAVNADFFDLETGEVENNQVMGGEIVRGTPLTDSPHDTFDNVHTQFAVTADGRPLIDRFRFEGRILLGDGSSVPIDRVNSSGGSAAVVLYTGVHDGPTPSLPDGAHLHLTRLPSRGDTAVYVVDRETDGRSLTIPAEGTVLAAGSSAVTVVRGALSPGDTVRALLGFQPGHGPIRTLVGGWPRIVRDGVSVAAEADDVEGTFPRFSRERHPRTAIGISSDRTLVYLVAVDGRQESSSGMTLEELAEFLLELGVHDALNLDGGGSTTLVIRGDVVNSPSGDGVERAVGNALLVHRRTEARE